jgi:hypothetical protein
MNRKWKWSWPVPCLLGLTVVAGCRSFSEGEASVGRPTMASSSARTTPASAQTAMVTSAGMSQAQTTHSAESTYAVATTAPASPQNVPPTADSSVVLATYEKQLDTESAASGSALAQNPAAVSTVIPPGDGLPGAAEIPTSGFAHAVDYRWICGQVQHSRIAGGWLLRFSSLADDDPLGGSVVLVENPDLDHLTDGQFIVARGHLTNPDDKGAGHAYRVDAFRQIARQD